MPFIITIRGRGARLPPGTRPCLSAASAGGRGRPRPSRPGAAAPAAGTLARVPDATTRQTLTNRLLRIPTPVMAGTLLALLGVGLLLGGPVGGALLGLAVAMLALMLVLLWPAIPAAERMLRLAVLVLAAALAIVRLVPPPGG